MNETFLSLSDNYSASDLNILIIYGIIIITLELAENKALPLIKNNRGNNHENARKLRAFGINPQNHYYLQPHWPHRLSLP